MQSTAPGAAAAGGAAASAANSPAQQARDLMRDLELENVHEAAVTLSYLDLSNMADADAVAVQMYGAAVGGKAQAVAATLAALVALESGGGDARLLRRLLLTRCEKAFNLAPPPGMPWSDRPLAARMRASEFVAALFCAGVMPASMVHGCVSELLASDSKPAGSSCHDAECAAVLLSGAGRQLDALSADSRRAMDGHIAAAQAAVETGKLKEQPLLAAKLQSLCALRATGWEVPQAAPGPEPALPSLRASPAAAASAAPGGGVAAAADALGRQLSLHEAPASTHTPANSPASTALTLPPSQKALQLQLPQHQQQGQSASVAGAPQPALSPGASRTPYKPLGHPPALPQPVAPSAQSEQPQLGPPSLQDRYAYLDLIDGTREHGPCSLEHLLHWSSQGYLPPGTKVRPEGSPAWLDLATVRGRLATSAPLPEAPPAGAAPSPREETFLYLDPDGSGREHGPCTMEQLLYWCGQGHLPPSTKVRRKGSPAWLDLSSVPHCLATGTPPAAPAAAVPAPAAAPQSAPASAGWPANGRSLAGRLLAGESPAGSALGPLSAAAEAAAASDGNGSSGGSGRSGSSPAGSQRREAQHSARQGGGSAPVHAPALPLPVPLSPPPLPPGFGVDLKPAGTGPAGQGAPAQLAQLTGLNGSPSLAPAAQQKPAQQTQQARPTPGPASAEAGAAQWLGSSSWADAEKGEEGSASAWETVAGRKPRPRTEGAAAGGAAVPMPVPLPARLAPAPSLAGSWGSPAGSSASSGLVASKAGRKKKSLVGYEDHKVWLLRSSRGKVTGPFSGHQLHDMLNTDEVPEDSLCKQEGWKAWKGIEEVEGMILEMYSRKPSGRSKGQQAQQAQQLGSRHSSDLENVGARGGVASGGDGRGRGSAFRGHGGSWQQRAVATIVQQRAAGRGSRAEQAGRQAGSTDAAQESPQPAPPPAAGTPGSAAVQQAPGSPDIGLATPQHRGSTIDGVPAGGGDMPAAGTPASPAYSLGTPSWRPAGEAGLLGGFTPSPVPDGTGESSGWDTDSNGGISGSPTGSSGALSPPSLAQLAVVAGGPQASSEVKPAFAAWSAAEAERRQRAGGMHK